MGFEIVKGCRAAFIESQGYGCLRSYNVKMDRIKSIDGIE